MVRHGQTTFNAAGRVQGHSESPLTELGIAQAVAVGGALAGRGIRHIYSSDLVRAARTAEAIGRTLELPVKTDRRLREVCFGDLEGQTWEELDTYFARAEEQGRGTWFDVRSPGEGGESRKDLQERAIAAVSDLVSRHPGETILVVSHGGFIGFFLRWLLQLRTSERYVGFRTANCAIHAFDHRAGAFHLVTWGERAHLDGL